MQFTKLFNSILDSTIWQEPAPTKICWITMLAMSDRNGEVHASVPGLARRAGISMNECENAITAFLAPDPYSRTKDYEGKRITEIDGGWFLNNHGKYRALLSAEERKEYNRRKQSEHRSKTKGAVNDTSMTVNDTSMTVNDTSMTVNDTSMTVNDSQLQSAMSAHTEAEAEAESEARIPPNPQGGNGQELFGETDIDQKDRYLPKDWRKITRSDQKKIKVLKNSPDMNQIGAWFGRREGTLWTIAEAASLLMVKPSQGEIDGMGIYYQADIPADDDIRRRDMATLLNNWSGELDRARKFVNSQKS